MVLWLFLKLGVIPCQFHLDLCGNSWRTITYPIIVWPMLAWMPRRYREFDTTSRLLPKLWGSCVSCCSVSQESWWSMLGTNQTHPSRIWLMMSHTCELHGGSFSWNRLASLAGTLPAGGSFCSVKRNQNPLRAFPPKNLPGYEAGTASRLWSARDPCCGPCCCHHTRPTWATGPMAGRFPCPGLPWCSGVPAAGSQPPISWEQRLTRERPWQQKDTLAEKKIQAIERHVIYVTQPNQGPNREERRDTQYRGVDSTRRGKAPPLAVFGDFLAAESYPSGASPPGWQA